MKKSLFLISFFSVTLCFSQSISPVVIGTAGDFYSNSNGMIQWTIGETMTETYGNASNFITQGFQQPDDFTTHVIVQNTLNIQLFPNPASDHFTLQFSNEGDYVVEIFNACGQKIISNQFSSASAVSMLDIAMTDYANGIYFVTIKKAGNENVSSFKLNKIS